MKVKVGINGFGRIGRNLFRVAGDDPDLEFVAVNDITDSRTLAHLLKYDSVLGPFVGHVSWTQDALVVNGKPIRVFAEKDPAGIPWKAVGAEIVVEATGKFKKKDEALRHINAGAKKVIFSAPATDPDITIVMGVNEGSYQHGIHHVLSNASCTTNFWDRKGLHDHHPFLH
jgi:glyceraldehyde 3-phosphate dehydrogenase